jgi:MFS family permease
MGLYPLVTALFTSLSPLVGVCAIAGFLDGGNGVVVLNRLIQVSPKSERPTLLGIHSMWINVCMLVAPLVSTALVDVWGTRPVLIGVGLLGLLGAATIYFLGWGAAPADAD